MQIMDENKPEDLKGKKLSTLKKKSIKIISLILIMIVVAFLYVKSTHFVQGKGYTGLFKFIAVITKNYISGLNAEVETISIQIDNSDFKKLEKNRKRALERGVIVNDIDGAYVPAMLEWKGERTKIKLRLKGHMTDHLQENKWSFRIKVSDENSFLGMKRFSVQHPGTRGYAYEWIYHQLMKLEGIIALRYQFYELNVNGKSWGVYALEENFDNDLLDNNHRVKGPVLRFNPDLYWVNRLNELEKTNSIDEYASYYSANPVAYREKKILDDSVQKKYYLEAIALIESLRSKKIKVKDAFDIEKLSKFHAIIDLVGGVHSIDWSDIKYYFNPVTKQFEPVAYESFTNLDSRDLSAFYKYSNIDSLQYYADWHTMLFSDPDFFKSYIAQLERMAAPAYLDNFFEKENTALEQNLKILNKEFPYKQFDKSFYYKRANIIAKLIDPPKAIHAYLKNKTSTQIIVQAGAIDALPVQLLSLQLGEKKIAIDQEIILPAKQPSAYVTYADIAVNIPKELQGMPVDEAAIKINYCIPGASKQKQTNVFPFPHTDYSLFSTIQDESKGNIEDFSFLKIDKKQALIIFPDGKSVVNKNLIIPQGYKVMASPLAEIDIMNHAKIISWSPVLMESTEERPIVITSSDNTGEGILLRSKEKSVFKYVIFKNIANAANTTAVSPVTAFESAVQWEGCNFYNTKAAAFIQLIRSAVEIKQCLLQNAVSAIDIQYSQVKLNNVAIENCKKNGVVSHGSKLTINNLYLNQIERNGIVAGIGNELFGNTIVVKNSNAGIVAKSQSMVKMSNVDLSNLNIGIAAYSNNLGEHPVITLQQLKHTEVKRLYLKEKNAKISLNGSLLKEETENVKASLK